MKRLLVMMAHPDDAEMLVGGTLVILRSLGWSLGIATMTAGDCGSSTHSKQDIVRARLAEARTAAGSIGAWYAWVGMKDAEVFTNAENLRRVVETMRIFAPDVVITHSPVDYMLDHEEASRLVRAAVFAAAIPLYETCFESPAAASPATPSLYYADPVEGVDSMGARIFPQFYVDITGHIEEKRNLLSMHRSQRDWLRAHHGMDEYLDQMTAWARRYGEECGMEFAEGLRQHLGHGHPHFPLLQSDMAAFLKIKK